MIKRIGGLLGSAALAGLCPLAALAQTSDNIWTPTEGPYIGGYVGANIPNHVSPHGGAADDTPGYFDTNVMGEGTLGYGFGNGFRVELEGGYFENDISKIHDQVGGTHNGIRTYTGMVNALYDIDPAMFGMADYGSCRISASVSAMRTSIRNTWATSTAVRSRVRPTCWLIRASPAWASRWRRR